MNSFGSSESCIPKNCVNHNIRVGIAETLERWRWLLVLLKEACLSIFQANAIVPVDTLNQLSVF